MLSRILFRAFSNSHDFRPKIITYTYGKPNSQCNLCQKPDHTDFEPVKCEKTDKFSLIRTGSNYVQATLLPNGYPKTTKNFYLSYLSHILLTSTCNSTVNFMNTQALFVVLGGQSQGQAILTSAALTWVLKDGIGFLVSAASSKKIGEWLCEDIKKWRCAAICGLFGAHLLDLVTLVYPAHFFLLASSANAIKAICYIALSGSSAAINQHFAPKNNLADIAAKCSVQGTLGTALGYAIGLGLSTFIKLNSIPMLAPIVCIGASVSLYTAYKALTRIEIPYFNYQRLEIMVSHYLKTQQIISPLEILKKEKILGALFLNPNIIIGKKPIDKILSRSVCANTSEIIDIFKNEKFMCVPCPKGSGRIHLFYNKNATTTDLILGYLCATSIYHNLLEKINFKDASLKALKMYQSERARREFMEKIWLAGWKTEYVYIPYDKFTYELN